MSAGRRPSKAPWLCLAALLLACLAEPALAQAKNPFSVGISEGGGSATGFTGWLLAQQGWFEHRLSLGVRAAKADGSAFWALVGMSLLYGVFHAAGPGHGKAVLASYMIANERAWRRGVVLSFLAALLQGVVAIALVGVLALGLHATAQRMKDSAALIETISFAAVACLGVILVWRKGRALFRLVRERSKAWQSPPDLGLPGFAAMPQFEAPGIGRFSLNPAQTSSRTFVCVEADAATHAADCAHCHAVDPSTLMEPGFVVKDAALTVFAAGSRPCSGAILVLVFALAQGIFTAGIASVFAMSLGVAVTTTALASLAVFAKTLARRLTRPGSGRAALAMAGLEFVAACVVLGAGSALLAGYAALGSA